MSVVSIKTLESETRALVRQAFKEDTAGCLTPRLVRRKLEQKLKLEEGSLDKSEYRSIVKATICLALEENDASGMEEVKGSKKRRSQSDNYEVSDVVSQPSSEKQSAKAKGTAASNPATLKKKEYKSAEFVNSSDMEMDDANSVTKEAAHDVSPPEKRRRLKKLGKREGDTTKTTQRSKRKSIGERETNKSSTGEPEVTTAGANTTPKSISVKTKSKTAKQPPHSSDIEVDETVINSEIAMGVSSSEVPSRRVPKEGVQSLRRASAGSESELSVLSDLPPKKRKAKDPKLGKEKKSRTKATTTPSKDEEKIKRLKSLVVACGVRKVWSKVFGEADTPQQQIKKINEILRGLGMTGRMSMEQAKAIREKRELAQELADVQQFANSTLTRSLRPGASANRSSSVEGASENEKGESEIDVPRKRATTARHSIMAFLEDQSNEE